jgi:hypothetical protein
MYEPSTTAPIQNDFSCPVQDVQATGISRSFVPSVLSTWPQSDGRDFWERTFLNAMANDRGPDISVKIANKAHDAWIKRFGPK